MFVPYTVVEYLEELSHNNQRDWFEANRTRYQRLRAEFTDFVQQLILETARIDPTLEGLAAERTLFRIHRDLRFSKDKTPYKTFFSASLGMQGKDIGLPSYYLHLDHNGTLMVAAGIYMPEPATATRIRQYLAAHPARVERLFAEPAFRDAFPEGLPGERLKRAPRGFDESLATIDLIKSKNYALWREEPITPDTTEVEMLKRCVTGFAAAKPWIDFLRDALGLQHGS